MCCIYKITNLINGKIYIGQTTSDIHTRMEEHIKMARNKGKNYALYLAMRKDGFENFKIEKLEECGRDELSKKEIFWIKKLKSFKNGYNMKRGGLVDRSRVPSQETIEQWWVDFQNGKSISKIATETSFGRTTIMKYLKNRKGYKELSKHYLCTSRWKNAQMLKNGKLRNYLPK